MGKMAASQVRTVLQVISAVLLLPLLTWAMDRASLGVSTDSYLFSAGYWLSALPGWVIFAGLVVLTGRLWSSFVIVLALSSVVYVANFLKLRYLFAPLAPADYYLLRSLDLSSARLLLRYVPIIPSLLAVIVLVAAVTFAWRREPRLVTQAMHVRCIVVVLIAATGYALVVSPFGASVYSDERTSELPFPMMAQLRAGLVAHLVHDCHAMQGAFEEPVDRKAVRGLLDRYAGSRVNQVRHSVRQRPDVVIVQSESFFNPDQITQVGDTSMLLPRLHEAMESGVGGSLEVPTFGGGTIRTEFEVLTGIPLAAYSKAKFPYLQFTGDSIPSLVHAFSDDGYRTVAVHGNVGSFWNRDHAFQAFGFERFVTTGAFGVDESYDGTYLSDHAMTDEVIRELSDDSRPSLIFAISIEAHGPYAGASVNNEVARAHIRTPEAFSADARDEYSRYAYHIASADREFGRLWDHLKSRGRPFLLVFYGDHLPGFRYVYGEASFRDGQAPELQRVPWVVVGSDLARQSEGRIYAWMLPQEILDLAGVKSTPYLTMTGSAGRDLQGLSPQAPAYHVLLNGLYSAARLDFHGQLDAFGEETAHAN